MLIVQTMNSRFMTGKLAEQCSGGGGGGSGGEYEKLQTNFFALFFSTILEKVVCNNLYSFLETHNILSGAEFIFHPGHSTWHPMLHFVNHISSALNNKEHTIAIFCDLRGIAWRR
jgi:hypothetical protein